MPGFRIITNTAVDGALRSAGKTAKALGFTVEVIDDLSFSVRKGSVPLSLLVGGAFSTYCDFKIIVRQLGNENVEIVIERNHPSWTTGWVGVNRVKDAAKKLADALAEELERSGGKVTTKEEI